LVIPGIEVGLMFAVAMKSTRRTND